ncbi:MAG: AbrB/MazE/SpoVT family DNA-binding domain-containing protein [Gammaproteobacteria bacterium]|nr:AbrB/MazE/SpoVT family DNA-binding domain-containing protein [Gammaproteobacteria bacterium]
MLVAKWGNSLAVRLPRQLVDKFGLKAGDELEVVSASARRIVLARDQRKELAVERMRVRALPIPDDYRFDRDAANAR